MSGLTELDAEPTDAAPGPGADAPAEGAPGDTRAGLRPVSESVRRRLTSARPTGWITWAATGVVVFIAAVLRLVNLSHPSGKIFDEIYYATEAGQLLQHGVEWQPQNNTGDFVVHPPLGKWMIALGIKAFGDNSFGWRISAAIVGTLSILIITRIAIRMFRSTVLGSLTGLLMALDGMHLVLSRTALLDIFLLFFTVASFACLVLDRDARRRRWLREIGAGLDPSRPGRAGRPRLTWAGVPWWRLAAGVLAGAACAVKWSAIFYVAVFVVLIVWWEFGARRSAGVRHPLRDTLLDETGWVGVFLALVFVTYLASWTGWFVTDDGWKRHYLQSQGGHEWPVLGALYNLWQYHVEAYNFHIHLETSHPYQSWPWQWLLLGRPVSFYWQCAGPCHGSTPTAEILLLGTPVLWWSFIPALLGLAWFGISRRDWRAGTIALGVIAGIVPWFWYELDHRTMFYFYALPAEPFLVMAVVYVLGSLIKGPGVRRAGSRLGQSLVIPATDRRLYGVIFASVYVAAVALCFWYFFPLYVGSSIPYDDWYRHMWLGNRWI